MMAHFFHYTHHNTVKNMYKSNNISVFSIHPPTQLTTTSKKLNKSQFEIKQYRMLVCSKHTSLLKKIKQYVHISVCSFWWATVAGGWSCIVRTSRLRCLDDSSTMKRPGDISRQMKYQPNYLSAVTIYLCDLLTHSGQIVSPPKKQTF